MSELVKRLSIESGIFPEVVRDIIQRAPISYKWYKIPKRNGRLRQIGQPSREVKVLQRIFVREFGFLPVHPAAMAYRPNASIKENAQRHSGNGPILKFDFADFFPSIRPVDWMNYCISHDVLAGDDLNLSCRLLFVRYPDRPGMRLAVGAPSSPWLSNVLMHKFDESIEAAVAQDHVIYTRYADDLTFSAQRTGYLNSVDRVLRKTLAGLQYPKLKINESKTALVTAKYRRVVTGITLANDGRITIGREKKRLIRSALHRFELGKLTVDECQELAGFLAHLSNIEPDYFYKIVLRHGVDLLSRLMRAE